MGSFHTTEENACFPLATVNLVYASGKAEPHELPPSVMEYEGAWSCVGLQWVISVAESLVIP